MATTAQFWAQADFMTGKKFCKSNRHDGVLDRVGVELKPSVFEEADEPSGCR
ncbi:hypothetical protein NKJ88_32355 [Mesorhizobium sp. M0016]|uniref:hypothetical protein n=1 Tax=Mesorhizobium sp. M0016 TaxID=2956843 RepID=UPI00333BC2C2